MGKSKKTLALVMALVMAFTIVPFGAWYGFKAAAEDVKPKAVEYYTPVTAVTHGSSYLIAVKDDAGNMYVLATTQTSLENYSNIDDWKLHIAGVEPFSPYEKLDDATEDRATWEYQILTARQYGSFFQTWEGKKIALDFGNSKHGGPDKDYVFSWPENEGTGSSVGVPQRQIQFNKVAGGADNEFTMSDVQDKGSLYFAGYDEAIGREVVKSNGDSSKHVFLYEKATELRDTMTLDITIRDLHADSFLIDMASPEAVFSLVSNDNNKVLTSEHGAYDYDRYAYAPLLNLAGDYHAKSDKGHPYRDGLTQENLKDGKLQYSPYAVIYVAHALREATYTKTAEANFAKVRYLYVGSPLFINTPLGNKLANKFMHYATKNGVLAYDAGWAKKYTGSGFDDISSELTNGYIQDFYKHLNEDADLKKDVDAFFAECANITSANVDSKIEAIAAAHSTFNVYDQAIVKDYWKTINHSSELNYERVVNDNPFFESLEGDEIWYYTSRESSNGSVGGYEYQKACSYGGAGFMDVAWYILHHFFENSEPATQNVPEGSREKDYQYFSKIVEDAPKELELRRYIKEDGTVSYTYNSAFDSNFKDANATTPLRNLDLSHNSYDGTPSDSTARFFPIDEKGFGNSHIPGENRNYDHNYGFSLEGNGKFVYSNRDNLFFTFNGDDDVFLYINGVRVDAVDLGGTHGPIGGTVYLNELFEDARYGLKEGQIATFDFFYMERNPGGSNFMMDTNIRFMTTNFQPQKNAYLNSDCRFDSRIPSGAGIANGDTVYYEFVVTNEETEAEGAHSVPLTNLKFVDEKLGVTISEDLVKGIDNIAGITYAVDTKNKESGEWEPEIQRTAFKDENDIKNFLKNFKLDVGQRIFIRGIPCTLDSTIMNKEFENRLDVFAKAAGVGKDVGTTMNLNIMDVKDKTFVVDFAGNLKFAPEKVYSADELNEAFGLKSVNVVKPEGTYGTVKVRTPDNQLTYSMNKVLNGVDTFELEETFDQGLKVYDDVLHTEKPFVYTTTKKVTFVPANNVYYNDSLVMSDGWTTTTGAGSVLGGGTTTDIVYGYTDEDVAVNEGVKFLEAGKEASFTFKGTGASVYLNTKDTSGTVRVMVYKGTGTEAERIPDNLEKVVIYNVKSSEPLNNVPIANLLNLDYGEHTVYIMNTTGSEAYLDGIRVYLPMENPNEYSAEKNVKFVELRDQLIAADTLGEDSAVKGSVYLDNGNMTDSIATYKKDGPKNEVYLKNENAIVFQIENYVPGMTTVQVAARSADGKPVDWLVNGQSMGTIQSTLDMYRTIPVNNDGTVIIMANGGEGILSLTNLKLAGEKNTPYSLKVSKAIVEDAVALANTPVEPEVPETPEEPETPSKPQSPIVKFFENVRNFFNKLFGKH